MSFTSRFILAKANVRIGKMMKPKNDRDSTPVTLQTAKSLPYVPKERPLSRGAWWFDGPNLTGCILMAKPRAGSGVDPLQTTLPNRNSIAPIHAESQADENRGYWYSDQPQPSSGTKEAGNTRKCCSLDHNPIAHEDVAVGCCSPNSSPVIIVTDTGEETCVDSAPSNCSLDDTQAPPPSEVILPPSARLPRGLVIFSKAQRNLNRFHKGFDYPGAILSAYKITKIDWSTFCDAMKAPFRIRTSYLGLRCIIDDILDVVSEWDRNVFRPKGLIMRIDMPGEAKYGLHFMDFYHKGHIDNCSGILTRKVLNYEDRKRNKLDSKDRHLSRVLERGYCSTRIVIDELAILKNERAANERGWTEWDRISNHARSIPPLAENDLTRVQIGLPFDDRWIHSKHIYYERYRGVTHRVTPVSFGNAQRSVFIWHPTHDSLDQRHGEYMLARRAVLPADCLPSQGIQRDHLVYWKTWAIEILMKDGYYGRDANTPSECFSKHLPSNIPPLPSASVMAPC